MFEKAGDLALHGGGDGFELGAFAFEVAEDGDGDAQLLAEAEFAPLPAPAGAHQIAAAIHDDGGILGQRDDGGFSAAHFGGVGARGLDHLGLFEGGEGRQHGRPLGLGELG